MYTTPLCSIEFSYYIHFFHCNFIGPRGKFDLAFSSEVSGTLQKGSSKRPQPEEPPREDPPPKDPLAETIRKYFPETWVWDIVTVK
jgi:hypothetical protein